MFTVTRLADAAIKRPCFAPKTDRRWLLTAAAAAAILLAAGGYCLTRTQAPAASPSVAPAVVSVTVQPASYGRMPFTLHVTGTVSAIDPLTIGAQANGLSIVNVLADEGDYVKKGQVLCTLNSSILRAELKAMSARMNGARASAVKAIQPNRPQDIAAAQAAYSQSLADVQQRMAMLNQAKASLRNAESNARRYEFLAREGAVSQQERDNRITDASTAQSNVEASQQALEASQYNADQAKERLNMAKVGGRREDVIVSQANAEETAANVEQLQAQIDQTIIRAPDDGLITRRDAHIGDVASPGKPLFEMIRQGKLELRAQVTQADLNKLKGGETASLSDGTVGCNGTVFQISPTVDGTTRLGTVRIALPQGSCLKPGMFVSGSVNLGQIDTLVIPSKAVLSADDKSYVFVFQNGTAQKRLVEIGARTSANAQIACGLSKGEQVIIAGAGFLNDGDPVKLVR